MYSGLVEEAEREAERLWRELESHAPARSGFSDRNVVIRTDFQTWSGHFERPAITEVADLISLETVVLAFDRDRMPVTGTVRSVTDKVMRPGLFSPVTVIITWLTCSFAVGVGGGDTDDVVAVCERSRIDRGEGCAWTALCTFDERRHCRWV